MAYQAFPPSGLSYDAQQTVAGAAVTSVDFLGLNGDTDGGYEIEAHIIVGATNPTFTLQPNALATNQVGRRLIVDASASPVGLTTLVLSAGTTIANQVRVWLRFDSRTGRHRFYRSEAHWITGAAVEVSEYNTGRWTATATAITSLRILSSVASGIDVDSRFTLRKLRNPLM